MINRLHVTPETYHHYRKQEGNHGRLPIARFTWGKLDGYGWAFLPPWAQIAMFPQKGTTASLYRCPERVHSQFWILRLYSKWEIRKHRNHDEAVYGRYWYGLAKRPEWKRPRCVVLDPDLVKPN